VYVDVAVVVTEVEDPAAVSWPGLNVMTVVACPAGEPPGRELVEMDTAGPTDGDGAPSEESVRVPIMRLVDGDGDGAGTAGGVVEVLRITVVCDS
jgi:hypothetical protein